ncbi:MAG: hypothetical protein V7K27_24620 [Nostoc sp.]|uniref:hypothetical protein n=1 Tax=Nostoc sp. TaxID=1180 RepID=UPI002FF61F18
MQNPEFRIQQSFSRGLGPATTKVDHQIIDLVGVQKLRLFIRFFGQNTQLNSDS